MAPPDRVPACFLDALEREFLGVTVEQFHTVSAACVALKDPVPLIAIDIAFLPALEAHADDLLRLYPAALIAVMQNDSRDVVSASEIFASRTIRGVLPMDLKLDVWLSVVRLMLRGGEYFPPSMFQSLVSNKIASAAPPATNFTLSAALPARPCRVDNLTERESQVLEMVSRGLQNKVIASNLHLSEHTVKIHLHNIITKLGAHNRTEAASLYRDRRDGH
ncbi:response regulator transcription factor [Aurantimonas sp. A2-1-M11]|uniref:helix-turn-helix transcriptional regulator n=1 Tax=Aurantimonas sp. A2-1-M11 TaxID=3113712 RepID=UPI002F946E76